MFLGRGLALFLVLSFIIIGSMPVASLGPQSRADDPYSLVQVELPQRDRVEFEAAYRRSLPAGAAAGAATVFSPDDRWQVTDTTLAPFRAIVQVVIFDAYDEIDSTCSGVLLTAHVVLTAAHCLYMGGSYAGGILVIPAQSGSYWPFGSGYGSRMAVPNGWADGRGASNDSYGPPSPFDWGIVVLDIVDWDASLGPFPVVATASDDFFARAEFLLGTAGYPGDKPIGTMWAAESPNYSIDETYLYTDVDVYEGQSGSPIFALHPDGSFVFSVVSGGTRRSTLRAVHPAGRQRARKICPRPGGIDDHLHHPRSGSAAGPHIHLHPDARTHRHTNLDCHTVGDANRDHDAYANCIAVANPTAVSPAHPHPCGRA